MDQQPQQPQQPPQFQQQPQQQPYQQQYGGAQQPQQGYAPQGAPGQFLPTSGKAIAALVLGICSIPTFCCYGFIALICGGLGLFFSIEAMKEIESGQRQGEGLAKAGRICSIIGMSLGAAYFIFIVVMVVIGIASGSYQ